jgi:hypothetical protein
VVSYAGVVRLAILMGGQWTDEAKWAAGGGINDPARLLDYKKAGAFGRRLSRLVVKRLRAAPTRYPFLAESMLA